MNETTEQEAHTAEAARVDPVVSLPLAVAQRLFEYCWSATSKLESQIIRNHGIPDGYADAVKDSFKALRELQNAIIER